MIFKNVINCISSLHLKCMYKEEEILFRLIVKDNPPDSLNDVITHGEDVYLFELDSIIQTHGKKNLPDFNNILFEQNVKTYIEFSYMFGPRQYIIYTVGKLRHMINVDYEDVNSMEKGLFKFLRNLEMMNNVKNISTGE